MNEPALKSFTHHAPHFCREFISNTPFEHECVVCHSIVYANLKQVEVTED